MPDTDNRPPNVLLLTAHDMGRYLGCYGRQAHTPVFDEFGSFSARRPTVRQAGRASRPDSCLNHGQMGHPDGPPGASWSRGPKMTEWHVDEDVWTLPMYLDEAGYETHLAESQHTSRPVERAGAFRLFETVSTQPGQRSSATP
jgi:arylsulfatase A-like enzyme